MNGECFTQEFYAAYFHLTYGIQKDDKLKENPFSKVLGHHKQPQ